MKLFVLCALMWVQALQVDHVTDQALDSQHTDCLVCKSIGDSALGDGTFVLQHIPGYAVDLTDTHTGQPLQTAISRAHPVRAPPATS